MTTRSNGLRSRPTGRSSGAAASRWRGSSIRRTCAGKRVVELGCGLAVPSIAAARGGAEVIATDGDIDALSLVRRNAEENGVELETAAVDWADPNELVERGPFDLALASDVLYERPGVAMLLNLLPRLAPVAWVADPGRPAAEAFFEQASRRWPIEIPRPRRRPAASNSAALRHTQPGGPGRALETSSSHSRHRRDRGDRSARRGRGCFRRAQAHGRLEVVLGQARGRPSWRRSRGRPTRSTGREPNPPTTTTTGGEAGLPRRPSTPRRGCPPPPPAPTAPSHPPPRRSASASTPRRIRSAATTPRCSSTGLRSPRPRRRTRSGR